MSDDIEHVSGEVVDDTSQLAEIRWELDTTTICLHTDEDGDEYWTADFDVSDESFFTVTVWDEDYHLIDLVNDLPQRYLELGNAAADRTFENRAEFRRLQQERDTFKQEYETLRDRIDGLGDDQRKERLLVILQEDLEKAINTLTRYAQALGIQQGGILYDQVQDLRTKYKMGDYIAPTSHDMRATLEPGAPVGHDHHLLPSPTVGDNPKPFPTPDSSTEEWEEFWKEHKKGNWGA